MQLKKLSDFVTDGTVDASVGQGQAYYFDSERILVNYARLVPSYIYTFNSTKPVGDDSVPSLDEYQISNKRRKPYYDNRPIFISLGQEGPMEVGINLKLMPLTFRKWFLRRYFKMILPTLSTLVDPSGNFIELNKRMRMQATAPLYKINREFIKAVASQTGFNLEFLVDKYTRSEMGNPLALIDWDQVPNLVNYSYMNDGTIISKTPINYFLTKFS
jgi:hypothetical protein